MSTKIIVGVPAKKYTNLQLVRDLFVFLGPYKVKFFFASFARMIGDISWLYPPIGLATVVTFFSHWKAGDPLTVVWVTVALWAGAFILRSVSQFAAKTLGFQASEKASLDAQMTVMRHLFRLDTSWHERENAGNKLKKMQRGSDAIDRLVRTWINMIIEIAVNFISIIIILATFDVTIAACFVGFILIYSVVAYLLTKRTVPATEAVNDGEEALSGLFYEGVNNVRTVKVLGMTESLGKVMGKSAAELYTKILRRISAFQFRGFVLAILTQGSKLGGLVFIIIGIIHGHFEVGFLVLFNGYFNRVAESVGELSDVSQDFTVAKFGIARMMELLAVPVGTDDEAGQGEFPSDWQTIAAENLSFSYGGHRVLHKLSFEIKRGERIGVVGLSGAGKSTLFKLLLKENEDYTGKILVDGVSLRNIKKSSYYKRAAVVLQDTEVFNFSLKENITIAKSSHAKNKEALKLALDTAHVTDFLEKLPEGTDTLIGEKGVKLSGGERQRVGIARAVFKEPELLFMDEATSHLDLESEEKIQDSLHQFFQSVTAIVIAHRLTTIKEMDRILVLEEGKLIESGSFDELYKKKGRFFDLWEKQKLG